MTYNCPQVCLSGHSCLQSASLSLASARMTWHAQVKPHHQKYAEIQ